MKKFLFCLFMLLSYNTLMASNCNKIEKILNKGDFSKITKNDLPCVTQLISEAMTLELPLRVDKYTELVQVTNVDNGLTYQYKLKGLDIEMFKQNEQKFVELVRNFNCTNPDNKWIVDVGIVVKQQYFDEKGKYVLGFDISKKTCQN